MSVIDVNRRGDEKVAKGSDALSVLENAISRNVFINELIEVLNGVYY